MDKVNVKTIEQAALKLREVVLRTPLQMSKRLSTKYGAKVYIKREDIQEVRSFKIRGAYNKIVSLTDKEKKLGVVCASAGNHAQGVAFGCSQLKIKGQIFMPRITPLQKIERVKNFGEGWAEVQLVGDTYDEACAAAKKYCEKKKQIFIHPFDDDKVISGQGTVAKEVYDKLLGDVDVVIVPVGGGGLIAGVSSYLKEKNKKIKVIGVEPEGAASMKLSLAKKKVVTLPSLDSFVDGAAVRTVGKLSFAICKKNVDKVISVPEGRVCTAMIELYQNEGVIAEPAGALSVSALDSLAKSIKGKNVVCVLSGGNNDILRYPEIMERSLVYQGRKHYFIVNFAQKPGQLKRFVNDALGPTDDIARFEYIKKTNKEKGPALIGVELRNKKDLKPLLKKMSTSGLNFRKISTHDLLYQYLI